MSHSQGDLIVLGDVCSKNMGGCISNKIARDRVVSSKVIRNGEEECLVSG
jgi:hypothetical protein